RRNGAVVLRRERAGLSQGHREADASLARGRRSSPFGGRKDGNRLEGMAARALAAFAGGEARRAFLRSTGVQPFVAVEWAAGKRVACREGRAHPSEIRTSVPIRRAKMSKFPTRISA